MLVDVIKVFIL